MWKRMQDAVWGPALALPRFKPAPARPASLLHLPAPLPRGGLVTEGLEVARLFLDGGVPIVVTESKAMAAAPPVAAGPALTGLPLTVLVNDHTASASEILAGAFWGVGERAGSCRLGLNARRMLPAAVASAPLASSCSPRRPSPLPIPPGPP
jgi:hypothetical protein